MADNGDDEDDLAVELGDGDTVRGVPLARVVSRLTWPIEESEIRRKEGQVRIRTQNGARPVADLLAEMDVTYFESRQEFVDAARDAIGVGPVLTE
ncbi:MAG: DUF5789 family protein [Halobacteriales archaeon]